MTAPLASTLAQAGTIPAWHDGQFQPVDKLDAHLRGLKHMAVSVFVMAGDRVLIQRRALNKYHTPGLWANTCCTHPQWNELAADCATRRLDEELGITGLTLRFADQVEYRADVGGGMTEHEVVDIFTAQTDATIPLEPNPDEVMDTRWVSLPDLLDEVSSDPQLFTPWLRIYLAEHRARIFGI